MGVGIRRFTFTAVAVAVWVAWPTGQAEAFDCSKNGVQYECTYLTKGKSWWGGYIASFGGANALENWIDLGVSPAAVDATLKQAMSRWFDTYIPAWSRGLGAVICGGTLLPFTGRATIVGPPGSTNNGFQRSLEVSYRWGESVSWCISGVPGVWMQNPPPNNLFSGKINGHRSDNCKPRGLAFSDWNYAVSNPAIEQVNYGLCFYPKPPSCPTKYGNPITATGVKLQSETDWRSDIPLLTLSRRYSSQVNREPSIAAASVVGRMSEVWMFGFQRHLWIDGNLFSSYREEGHNVGFPGSKANDGRWHSEGYALLQTGVGYELTTPQNTLERYDSNGRLVGVHDASGASVVIAHDLLGRIATVTSNTGRQLRFEYSTLEVSGQPGVLREIVLPDGQRLRYDIDESSGWLNRVTFPDGTYRAYSYTTQGDDTPLLTSIRDEAGGQSLYTYVNGVATSTSRPGSFGTWTVSQNRGTLGTGNSTITSPTGAQHQVTFAYQSGRLVVASNTQPAGSGCAAATLARQHDARGNVVQEDDLDTVRTCRSFEAVRNLETQRVEGLPSTATCSTVLAANAALPDGARKVSTEWHPDWRLARRIAEPRRLVLTIHHGQPDPLNGNQLASCAPAGATLANGQALPLLCREVQYATTDTTGAAGFAAPLDNTIPARQQTWTYDTQGRVLSWTDTTGSTTRYAYQTAPAPGLWPGDLVSETNGMGHVTQYTAYSPNGQWLNRSDPNGTQTVRRFDLRNRLIEETTAAQATGYAWMVTGQLSTVTQPDGSWVSYEYDVAQRLVGVQDSAGRRIGYTLDAAGNRTGEEARDPGGQLRRSVQRSFDALNRMQQQTGRELAP